MRIIQLLFILSFFFQACEDLSPLSLDAGSDQNDSDTAVSKDLTKRIDANKIDLNADSSQKDQSLSDKSGSECLPGVKDRVLNDKIMEAWNTALPRLKTYLNKDTLHQNPYPIYNVQLFSANILMYADYYQDRDLIESLADLYRIAYLALRETSRRVYYFAKGPDDVVRRTQVFDISPSLLWTGEPSEFEVGTEATLPATQFLYAVARLVRMIGEMSSPSTELLSFVNESVPILSSHYRRWLQRETGGPGIFQVKGWGCNSGTFDHQEHVENLRHRRYGTDYFSADVSTSYCNAVTDTDLWIIAGIAELYAASKDGQNVLDISSADSTLFESHVKAGIDLIESRHDLGELNDPKGGKTDGAVFDRGAFDDHPDVKYAGFNETGPGCDTCPSSCTDVCPQFPGWKDVNDKTPRVPPNPVTGIGWDLSHARRLVSVFDSLRRQRHLFNASFPRAEHEAHYARQLAYGVWNGDESDPKFSTYFDGTNGWYRVNYSGRVAFGYAPFAMTETAITCGYGFWNAHDARLEKAMSVTQTKYASQRDPTNLSDALALILSLPESAPYSGRDGKCIWPKE